MENALQGKELGIAVIGSGRIGSLRARINLETTIPIERAAATGKPMRLPLGM